MGITTTKKTCKEEGLPQAAAGPLLLYDQRAALVFQKDQYLLLLAGLRVHEYQNMLPLLVAALELVTEDLIFSAGGDERELLGEHGEGGRDYVTGLLLAD